MNNLDYMPEIPDFDDNLDPESKLQLDDYLFDKEGHQNADPHQNSGGQLARKRSLVGVDDLCMAGVQLKHQERKSSMPNFTEKQGDASNLSKNSNEEEDRSGQGEELQEESKNS